VQGAGGVQGAGAQGGGVVQVVDQVDSPHLLGATNWVGRPVPLHASALGKALLAHRAAELPPGRLERLTGRTLTSREVLAAELEEARRRGYATMIEELEVGLVAVAAPVFRDGGVAVAALSVSGPTARLGPARLREAATRCVEQANALSEILGHRPRREGAA
ncbi:MAG: IclR family transcriptional regulator, partial [Acidimicrobiales bacterium]